MDHGRAVTKHHLAAENTLDEGYWDEALRETHYFEEDESPHPPYPDEKGRQVGEFDVLLLNYEDQLALYKEIKTSYGDLGYAQDQIQRAKEHFEETSWDVIGTTVLEN